MRHGSTLRLIGATLAAATLVGRMDSRAAEPKIAAQLQDALQSQASIDYLVLLHERADVSAAASMIDRNERGREVYGRLRDVAARTQARILARLSGEIAAGQPVRVKPFFSVNAIGVRSSAALMQALAAFPEVERIVPAVMAAIPDPTPADAQPHIQGVEWNISRIRAPELWAAGIRGQNIVVGSIDTGVQFDHPALAQQYRGNLGGGTIDHNHQWWDASGFFGGPGDRVPTDTNGHGTHTMGTMIGDDGGSNKIGVAPGAQWMTCKACADGNCSFFGLLECGDFMLAPWDLDRQNPNPDLRPHVVNNSWSFSIGGFDVYRDVVRNWIAAGIFPAFAGGNFGPACGSAVSPGDYPEAFGTAAIDMNDTLASFSSRGPSMFGGIVKPDVSAPGVAVRSSVPPNAYATFSGTSMASPHTAGVVALLWSAYPGLRRDVASTALRLRTAGSILNTSEGCGGDSTATHPNNSFGSGVHDAVKDVLPVNVFTDRSIYGPGDTMALQFSLANPMNTAMTADLHFGLQTPGGATTFFPAIPFSLPALAEYFNLSDVHLTWGSEPTGAYRWIAVLTAPGGHPGDAGSVVDVSPFTKR